MDLGGLSEALAAGQQEERPWGAPGETNGVDGGGIGTGLVEDVYRRHGKSRQGESRRICAMLGAMVSALAQQNVEPKPAALFASLVLALEGIAKGKQGRDDASDASVVEKRSQDEAALLYLLEEAASRMPRQAVRTKFERSVGVVCGVLGAKGAVPSEASTSGASASRTQCAKFGVGCLASLLCAHDPRNFLPASKPFGVLLSFCVDPRPKVRKRAQAGLAQVLVTVGGVGSAGASLERASAMVRDLCERSVAQLVEVTEAFETSQRTGSKREARRRFEEGVQRATTRCFHVLGALRQCVAFLSPREALDILKTLDGLMEFREVLLAHHSAVVIGHFFQGHRVRDALGAEELASLLRGLTDRLLTIEELMADADVAGSTLNALLAGFHALAQMDSEACLAQVPSLLHRCLHYFRRKDSEAFRIKMCSVLAELIDACVDEGAVAGAAAAAEAGQAHPLLRVVAGVEAMVTVPYQDSWNQAFQLLGKLCFALGKKGGRLLSKSLAELGRIAAGEENEWTEAVQDCVGVAVRSLGPEAVLEAIPLNIEGAVTGGGEANSWLVYVLKKNVSGASLSFWARELLPEARRCGQLAASLGEQGDVERAVLVAALEHQLWQTLPSFCRWAEDAAEGFRLLAKPLGAALQNREDLRSHVCNAIALLVSQNARAAEEGDNVGDFGGGVGSDSGLSDDGNCVGAGEDEFDGGFPRPEGHTSEGAEEALRAVASYSKNYLPLLFNLFVSSRPSERGRVHAAIAAFGRVTGRDQLDGFYKNILKRMATSLQGVQQNQGDKGAKDAAAEQQGMLMDIAAALVPGLKPEALEKLLGIVNVSVVYKDPGIQKKSYKLLRAILSRSADLKSRSLEGVRESLSNAQSSCYAPAKKYRLLCVRAMVSILDEASADVADSDKQDAMTSLVTEIVMCTKEKNSKTHRAALDLLAETAHGFKGLRSAMGSPLMEPGPLGFINVVAGGLVAQHPHMVSATVVALTRLAYQFAREIGEEALCDIERAVAMLLKTKSREVVKSVLAFLSMFVTTLDAGRLHEELPSLVEHLLIWANDTKNRFRLKIRHILEKVIRVLGLDEVTKFIPEEHQPLIRYIRKQRGQEKRKREGGSVAGASVKTGRTRGKQTTWTYAEDDDDEGGAGEGTLAGRTQARTARTSRTAASGSAVRKRQRMAPGGGLGSGEDPSDLLDSRNAARMGSAHFASRDEFGDDDDGPINTIRTRKKDGKLIIKDDRYESTGGDGGDGDENMDDSRSHRSGKSARSGKSGRTAGTARTARTNKTARTDRSIVRAKGTKKLEPFAYWPMDRKMLNRRAAKRKDAKKGLLGVVKSKANKKNRR